HTRGTTSQKHVDRVGFYNPKTKEKSFNIERIKHWLGVGAQPSETVHNMLVTEGVIDGAKKNVLSHRYPAKKEEASSAEADAQKNADTTQKDAEPEQKESPTDSTEEEKPEEVKEEAPAEEKAEEQQSVEAEKN
ncbi:MAG: 30S ribosomal protein S16, partial [bacterium]|nr:30S ribosomal protein S16 [bacterium]